jgi:hypothetical protein
MPRKPNYRFERSERDKAKAAKKAARLQEKAERAAAKRTGADGDAQAGDSEQADKDS